MRMTPAKMVHAQVGQWFATTASGSMFLPGDGRVLPISRDEALAIRAGAEEKAIEWFAAFERLGWIAIAVIVATVMVTQSIASRVDSPWKEGVRAAGYAIYSVHGLWLLWEALAIQKKMKALRAGIALSLQGRVPLDPMRAGSLGAFNPIAAIVTGIVLILFLWNWVAEIVSHRGIDLIGIIPPWLPITVVIFVWIVAIGNKWIDKSRGIGVEPPRNFNARIEQALDRERTGR